jgi:hypothetical protein
MNVDLAAQRAMDHLAKVGFDHLSETDRILAAVWEFAAGVANNGFAGYYTSRWADLAFYAPSALQQIGATGLAEIEREANALFGPDGPSPEPKVRVSQLQQLGAAVQRKLAALDDRYFDVKEDVDELLETWFRRLSAAGPR